MFGKLTEKLDSFLKMGVPFYDCAVMKDGKCVYRHFSGFTDVKNQIAVTGKKIPEKGVCKIDKRIGYKLGEKYESGGAYRSGLRA